VNLQSAVSNLSPSQRYQPGPLGYPVSPPSPQGSSQAIDPAFLYQQALIRQHSLQNQLQTWPPSLGLPSPLGHPQALPYQVPSASGFQPSSLPAYAPSVASFVPGRLATNRTLNQDTRLQSLSEGYQQSALRDMLAINECGATQNRSGELLYLPVNFISHLRGVRAEEEEILQTSGGSKLVLSQGRKVSPEKLTSGLFFGANARILARMIPQLTPELASYLDYLRKVGDLLINYTAASVYLLDNEHRLKWWSWQNLGIKLILCWLSTF
jgi:hypothetical protein